MSDELKETALEEEKRGEKAEELQGTAEEAEEAAGGGISEELSEADRPETEEPSERETVLPEAEDSAGESGESLPAAVDDDVQDSKELLAWAQKAGSKMTGGDQAKANKLKAEKNAVYQVDCSVMLDSDKFYEISLWNMFCRKKIFVILMGIIYALSLLTIGGAVPKLTAGDVNGFIISGGMGFIILIVFIYMLYSQINRFKRISKNEESIKKTAKHFRFTREMITNYRVEAQEERKYEWNQVSGAYDRPEEIVIAIKKDEQLLVVQKDKLSDREMEFLRDIIDEKHLWKKSMSKAQVIGIFAAITAGGVLYIVGAFLR